VQNQQLLFLENLPMQGTIININLQMEMQWKFQKIQYPYLNDSGSGVIGIRNMNISATIDSYCDYVNCPNHLGITIKSASIEIEKLQL
jgi:hypothetical protein